MTKRNDSPRKHPLAATNIRLSEALEYLPCSDQWRKLVTLVETRNQALRHLNWSIVNFHLAMDGDSEVIILAREILQSTEEALRAGQIRMSGVPTGGYEPVLIASQLWSQLRLDFTNERASSDTHEFVSVCLELESDRLDEHKIIAAMTNWLEQQKSRGRSNREYLKGLARKEFGAEFKDRLFQRAYGNVFKRRPGRPRNP